MQSVVNEPFLKKRATYARWGSYLGIGALFVGLVTSTRYPLLAYLFLLIGLLGATFGSYMTNRYVREPRADQTLEDVLNGLDKRYRLYSYYLPSDHVIASHFGLTALVAKPQEGEITYDGGRWHHKAGWRKLLQLFGEPSLSKPDQELEREVGFVAEWIGEVMPEQDIPVSGVIVFTSPRVALNVTGLPVSAVTSSDLADHMKRGFKGQPPLSTAVRKELGRILDEVVAASQPSA